MLSEIVYWPPQAVFLVLAAGAAALWLGLTAGFLVLRAATQWLINLIPEPAPRAPVQRGHRVKAGPPAAVPPPEALPPAGRPVTLTAADVPPASGIDMFASDELEALARLAADREFMTCPWAAAEGQRIADFLRTRFGDDMPDAQLGRLVLAWWWRTRRILRASPDDTGPAWHLLSDSLAAAALDLTAVELRAEEAL